MARSNTVGVAWTILLFWSRFGINSLVFVVIARWIDAADIGAYGVVFAIVQIIQAVQMSGLPEAVIRSEHPDSAHTAFWLSVGFGAVTGVCLYLSAPIFGMQFGASAQSFARALAVVPFATGIGAISEAELRRHMLMDRLALRTSVTLVIAGIITIVLAAQGAGGWALIAFSIVNSIAGSLLNLLISPWKPAWKTERQYLRGLLSDAAAISGHNVLKAAITPTSQFIVSTVLGVYAGGIYLIAVRFVGILYSLTILPAQYAALPIFARVRSDPARRDAAFVDASAVMSALSSPIYIGAAAVAPTILPLILGTIGAEASYVAQGLLFHTPVLVLTSLGLPALISVGSASSVVVFTTLQAIANVPLTVGAAFFSVTAVGWSYGALYYVLMPLLLQQLQRKVGINVRQTLSAVFLPWIAALVMGAIVWGAGHLLSKHWDSIPVLATQILIGVLSYVAAAFVIARGAFRTTIGTLARLRRRGSEKTG